MDRLEDLHRISRIYVPSDANYEIIASSKTTTHEHRNSTPIIVPPFLKLAISLFTHLEFNDQLKDRMLTLVGRKEFSNDPTKEMSEISTAFERTVNQVQRGLTKLLQFEATNKELSAQPRQHLKAILTHLRGSVSMQVQEFKLLLKAHSDNVQQRQTRVSKYSGSSAGREGEGLPGTIASLSQNYAMFSHTGPYSAPLAPVSAPSSSSSMTGNAELRRRNVSVPNTAQQQVQMTRARYQQEESFRSAQKVEASLAQMGELFTQMSSLVMEQAETVLRIEDDVEAGLADTTEAHASMLNVYEITRGNRGVIIKVFLLLIFFIIVFLVLT